MNTAWLYVLILLCTRIFIAFVLFIDVEKHLLASESDMSSGQFSLLYSAPEAILDREAWKHLLVQRPLCDTMVAVAVDEAHCVYKW